MGTRGLYVYRYRNIYFVYESSSDSYPEGLGVKMLQTMRQPNAISKARQRFGEILDKFPDPSNPPVPKDSRRDRFYEGLDFIAQKDRPKDCCWIYEIDLDRNIFHVDGVPFFSLECLPNDEDFPEYISKDSYGNSACALTCPPEHKYKRPAPPVVPDCDLVTYRSLECIGTAVALSDLLAINDTLSPDEHIRVSLLEVMIAKCMERSHNSVEWPDIGQMVYDIEIACGHDQLTDNEWMTACSMANLAFVPQIFDSTSEWIFHPELCRKEFTWVREDTVVFIATHLDDERCLQASISRLIDAILEQKNDPGDYFGVAFSVYHCAIVKVVKYAHKTTISHTAALQFLPSFYADHPSTPGITALTRLGYRVDPLLYVRATKVCRWLGITRTTWRIQNEKLLTEGANTNIRCAALPCELWREIALQLHFRDLIQFGLVSKLFREVASTVLRHPHVCGYRLVAKGHDDRFLDAASFAAVREGIPFTLFVGLGDKYSKKMVVPFVHRYWVSVRVSVEEVTESTDVEGER